MYYNYPLSFLVLYCEQNDSKQESYELIKQIKRIVKKRIDYFTFNHLIVHLVVNNLYETTEQYFKETSVSDPVFNIVHYCAGYQLSELFGKIFQYHKQYINRISKTNETIKVIPTKVLAIQRKQESALVKPDLFNNVQKYVKLTSFILSSSKVGSNEGDFDQLDLFLDDFMKNISNELSNIIKQLEVDLHIPEQDYLN